jgi:hypothetical protein
VQPFYLTHLNFIIMASQIPNYEEIIEEHFVLALKDSAEKYLVPRNSYIPTPSEMGYGVEAQEIYDQLVATARSVSADPRSYYPIVKDLFAKHAMNPFDFYQNYVNGNPQYTFDVLTQQYGNKGLLAMEVGGGFNQGFAEGTPEQGNRLIDFLAGIQRNQLFA